MKLMRMLKSLMGFFALVLLSAGAHAASGAGPYYATPSWDQQLPGATRFVVLSNWVDANFPNGGAAVLDRETGLVWEQSPTGISEVVNVCNGACNWFAAQAHCNILAVGNRKGWRLPTVQELASLVDRSAANPALPAGHPFSNVQSTFYQSATSNADPNGVGLVWGVKFDDGSVFNNPKSAAVPVWCVRGGPSLHPQ